MDQNKHLTDEGLEQMLEEGFDFEDVVGQKISFDVAGFKNEDGRWDIDAKAEFYLSNNGEDWAGSEFPISTSDNDFDSALSTVMLGVVNALNNPKLLATMRAKLNDTLPQPAPAIEDKV